MTKTYFDLREEESSGERYYLDRGHPSRHLMIRRKGCMYRTATKDGFIVAENGPQKNIGANAFSNFIERIWKSEPDQPPSKVAKLKSDFQVPKSLGESAKQFSKDLGLRFTWEQKNTRFTNSLGVDKSKSEFTRVVRADYAIKQDNGILNLRKFLHHPTPDSLPRDLEKFLNLKKQFKKIQSIVPHEKTRVILDPTMSSVWIHEVVGHFLEETSLSGTFMGYKDRKLAPDFVSIDDVARGDHGIAFDFDDEGFVSKDIRIIDRGVVREPYLTLTNAYKMKLDYVNGRARAQDFKFRPIPRMMNIALRPTLSSVDDLMKDIKDGYFLCGSLGGIRGRDYFQVQSQYGFKIENGKKTYAVFGPMLVGNNMATFDSLVGVSKEFEFVEEGGCLSDGQFLDTSGRGSPYTLLNDVTVF